MEARALLAELAVAHDPRRPIKVFDDLCNLPAMRVGRHILQPDASTPPLFTGHPISTRWPAEPDYAGMGLAIISIRAPFDVVNEALEHAPTAVIDVRLLSHANIDRKHKLLPVARGGVYVSVVTALYFQPL